jgi:hypothetical protein
MLSQLVYVSNRNATCTPAEIEKILNSCKKNNPSLNITGVLLYTDKKFMQLVEGDAKVIVDLYDKIKKDQRHSNVMMISYNPIKEKSFPSWHMASKDISKTDIQFKTDISADDKRVFNEILSGKEENGQKVLMLLKKFF